MPVHGPIVIAGGARTPIGRFNGALAKVDAVDLGAHAVRAALERTGLEPDYIAVGNVLQAANGQNPGRRAALQGGVAREVPGITLNDVCLASMSAVALAASMIRAEEAGTVLVGGFDSMTRAPHALRLRPGTRMGDAPMIDVMIHDGLYCSIADEGMGGMSDAENARLGITRRAQDEFAARSHELAAQLPGDEIVPLNGLERDEGVRETSYEALAALPPAFTPDGTITAGNASQVSDGAAAALITTADRTSDPLAEVVGRAVVAGPDSTLHLRPAEASAKVLERHGLKASDIDLWEVNEAFAGVVLASATALEIDLERVNVNGGAVALGHPLAGSGLRLVLTLAYELRRRGGGLGIATLCGGGGQGEAILLRVIDVLVIGAGPYGLAAARAALAKGLSVEVIGRPMGFWRDHMPAGMLLRSGPDWHMDPLNELTFQAFCPDAPDPIPLELFLDYGAWFQAQAKLEVTEDEVTRLRAGGDAFEAWTASGLHLKARSVVAAPGVGYFAHRPDWAPEGAHTCDLVDFQDLAGAHVVIVGGRQSAYEWAALIHEAGAEKVHVVHRHEQPRFDRVSWAFVDEHIDRTLAQEDYWRRLSDAERAAIARRFWEVGRLTLEYWLEPRIGAVEVHANAEVAHATAGAVTLDDGTHIPYDRIVLATGYQADLSRVPYLPPVGATLDAHMQSALPGLYLPGFVATHDFGPFFGFVKGAPAAATLVARGLDRNA